MGGAGRARGARGHVGASAAPTDRRGRAVRAHLSCHTPKPLPSPPKAYTTESGARYFVKTSLGRGRAMFDAEAAGLRALRAAAGDGLVIPDVLHVGVLASVPGGRGLGGGPGSFIVMEHLDLGAGRGASQRALGEGLARLHLAPPSDARAAAGSYGFAMDNTIGATHQPNAWCDDWVSFFRERRLNHMLALLNRPSLNTPGKKVAARLDALFAGVTVRPSLIHGDLWSGNIANVDGGRWSILDPAAYYGHHEAEFGMSWCANFGPEFWAGYRSLIPEDPGFRVVRAGCF